MHVKELAFRLGNSETLHRTVKSIGIILGAAALFSSSSIFLKLIIGALFVILLTYSISPLFFRGYGIEWLLNHKWHCYHLTRDESHPNGYWVIGSIEFEPSSTRENLKASHTDINPPRHNYQMKGYLKNGAMLFFERNVNDDIQDECLAYFPSLRNLHSQGSGGTRISGFWLGYDQTDQCVAAPYVLSATTLTEKELEQCAKDISVISAQGVKNES